MQLALGKYGRLAALISTKRLEGVSPESVPLTCFQADFLPSHSVIREKFRSRPDLITVDI
jgi:hypothetical protein